VTLLTMALCCGLVWVAELVVGGGGGGGGGGGVVWLLASRRTPGVITRNGQWSSSPMACAKRCR